MGVFTDNEDYYGTNVSIFILAHLHTCILAYLHKCILAYLHCILALHTCTAYSFFQTNTQGGDANIFTKTLMMGTHNISKRTHRVGTQNFFRIDLHFDILT